MAESIDITCIAELKKFDPTILLADALNWSALHIGNVADMADKIVLQCTTAGTSLGELRIVGHGNAFGQYVGSDWLDKDSLNKYRTPLRRIGELFGSGGLLTMGGCLQGQNGGFLLALSDLLNVPVRGFTASQRPAVPGDQGSETRCYITCARGKRDMWDYIDN